MIRIEGFKFKTEPWAHQLEALKYLSTRNAAALYTDMGSGKTKIMIDLIQNQVFKRVLIVCPNKVCSVWEEEIAAHGYPHRISAVPLYDSQISNRVAELKKYDLRGSTDSQVGSKVFIINYESVWRPDIARVLLHRNLGIDCVICDESHRIKTPGSKCSKFLTKIGKQVSYRYLMTGTPLAENPMDVYAQYRFLDQSVFGTSFSRFKAEYENVDIEKTKYTNYTVLDKKRPYNNLGLLRKKMFSIAFSMESDVVLPPVTKLTKAFYLSSRATEIYRQVSEDGAINYSEEEVLEVTNVLSKILRLQQVTSGYLALENVETKERRLKRIDKSRLEVLEGLLEGIPRTEGVIVFAKFTRDLADIRGLCNRMSIKYSELSGHEDTLKEWKAGNTQVIGIQYKAGSEGVTLVRARYCIYYSLTHSLSLYQQSLKRVHRPGQKRPVTYYHIVGKISGKKTIDEDIIYCLKRKKDIVHEVMKRGG